MLGYFFFGVTSLIVIGFTFLGWSKPNSSSDGLMGYGLGLAFLGLAFTVSSGILTFCVGWKGGFNWVSDQSSTRHLIVGFGWLCMAIATFACAAFKWEWHQGEFPIFLRWLAKSNGQTWIPLLMLVPYFYLLSAELRASVAPQVYKMPLMIAFGLTVFMVLGLLFGWVRNKIEHKIAVHQAKIEEIRKYGGDRSWYFKTSIDYINSHNDTTITRLIFYTIKDKDRNQAENEEIRKAAIAKIESYPHWESDVIQILEGKAEGSIYNVYGFLKDYTIEHREKFVQPIKNSIIQITAISQKSIKEPDNFYLGSTNIAALCHILETQFEENAAEFRPNMLKLQQVLDITPAKRSDTRYAQGFNEVLQESRLAVKNWLEKH
jgi:hypothetical protein